jgi:hypothetical protein
MRDLTFNAKAFLCLSLTVQHDPHSSEKWFSNVTLVWIPVQFVQLYLVIFCLQCFDGSLSKK